MNKITLFGCRPMPLASYLKALGIFRIISQQCPEAGARGAWRGNTFVLTSTFDEAALRDFFLTRYIPSPVLAPWNGGSGFYPKDNAEALETIAKSESPRFAAFREALAAARNAIATLGLREKPEKDTKEKLLLRCRNTFPEAALEWLDSAVVLTDDGTRYPPLLGTGGNDGRLEFTNNFMQRLTEVFDLKHGGPSTDSATFLDNALFDEPVKGLADSPIGQFSPVASGGANATTGFDAKSVVNPWDFILSIEGAMLFAAAAVKRLESAAPGLLAYPFCVQPAGAGYGSASQADETDARCEIWMPLWSASSNLDEIRTLFSEGRAWVGRRPAKDGVDFALAVASLGVDRGIAEFQRFAFLVRNGLAYFATPLQRVRVQRDRIAADLLAACDGWLTRFRYEGKKEHAPTTVRRAVARVEAAILARVATPQGDNPAIAQELLMALGAAERAVATRQKWRKESFVPSIPALPSGWLRAADDNSVEYRLAAALASIGGWFRDSYFPLRRHLEPVTVVPGGNGWVGWDDEPANEVVWHEGSIVDVMLAMMERRLLLAKSSGAASWPEFARVTAWPSDLAAFIDGRIDEKRFTELLWGLSLLDFSQDIPAEDRPERPGGEARDETPPAFFAQLKLCFAGRLPEDKHVPVEPDIFHLAATGNGERASEQALRRLHGSSIPVLRLKIPIGGTAARRSAAALLFPLWDSQLAQVGRAVAPNFFPELINS